MWLDMTNASAKRATVAGRRRAIAIFRAVAHGVAGLWLAAAIAAGTVRAAGGLKAGDVLDTTNWQQAEGLLPPEILKHYREGEYANKIYEWPAGKFDWPTDFLEASKANAGRYEVGTRGEIADKATGKQPSQIFGLPFPDLDPKDPQAGTKIIWNFFYFEWYWGSLRAQSQVNFVGPRGLERRTDQDVAWLRYDGAPARDHVDNPQNFSVRQLYMVRAPADLNGTASLSWRYRDPEKRDSVWAYVPAMRRVRAVSPSNRSDGFLGSDMAQDDGPLFDGKPEDFIWKLVGEVDHLRLIDPLSFEGKCNAKWVPTGGWRLFWPDINFLGYQDPSWKGAGWAPIAMGLAKRRLFIVEATPKDKYYLYGKLQLYLDKETYQGAFNRKFNWQGELLMSFQVMTYNPIRMTRPDGTPDFIQGSNMSFICVENIKLNRATIAGQKWNPNAALDVRAGFEPNFFEIDSLSRFGK